MRFSFSRTSLAGCIAASMLLAAPAYAVDPPNPAQINAPTLETVQVSATTYNDIPPPDYSGTVSRGVKDLVGHHAYLFLTNSNDKDSSNDKNKDPSGGKCSGNYQGDPIDVSKGNKVDTYPVFSLPGEMGLAYVRYYNPNSRGNRWTDNLSYELDTACLYDPNNNGACYAVKYYRPDGSTILFSGAPGVGPFTEVGGGGLISLTYNPASATYTLQDEPGTTETFAANGLLLAITNASGVSWTLSYNAGTTVVTHTNGQSFTIGPNSAGSGTAITDPAGNVYTLTQGKDASGNGTDILTFPGSPTTAITFSYNNALKKVGLLSEVDYNGVPYQYTTYVTSSTDPHYQWANGMYLADGSGQISINYATDAAGNLQATVTNPLGHNATQTYDGTNGSGGAYNGQLSLVSNDAVADCGATVRGRSYDASGHLSETIDNNGNVHTYTYAVNGQLQSETEAYGTAVARTTDYVWDPNQQLNRLLSATVEGWRKTTYAYNAQNRLASLSVTNLSGNGSANQSLTTTYSYALYGNGLMQTMTVTRPSPSGSDTSTYQYDTLGNLTSFRNGLGQTTSYSNYNGLNEVGHVVGPNGDVTDYTYDARGRMASKTSYPNGSAATWTYTYDGFGLLYTQSGPDGQVTTWTRNPSTMRVSTITHNDKDGTSTESFSYDANGDVLEHKVTRGSAVGLDEVFHYDALGRVYQKVGQNGQSLTYAYDGNGNVLSVADAVGHTISYQYDALDRVAQKSESGGASPAMPTTAPTINAPSSSTSGAYTVSWNSLTGATYYVLQEQPGGGSWNVVQSGAAVTWQASGRANNTYNYEVKACNATGCGPWSSVGSTTVVLAPTSATSLTVPSSSANGNYTVSWSSVANTSTYTLQEQVNGGSWNTIQNNGSLSWSVTGKTNGTYAYRAQACNALSCSPWSNTGTIVVTWPPVPAVPTWLSSPQYTTSNTYTVTWNSTANAATYSLREAPYGGSWSTVSNSAATSWTSTGHSNFAYVYEVQACNVSGCSAYSSAIATTVTVPAPLSINGQGYSATNTLTKGSGFEGVGFSITGGNTWQLYKSKSGTVTVIASGSIPFGANTVRYTWTDEGVPSGYNDAGGSVAVNQAGSPVAVSNNPQTEFDTLTHSYTEGDTAHDMRLQVDFFNGGGQNMSSSACDLSAQVISTQ